MPHLDFVMDVLAIFGAWVILGVAIAPLVGRMIHRGQRETPPASQARFRSDYIAPRYAPPKGTRDWEWPER